MYSLFIYLIQASLSIAVFYIFYELLFRSEAYFKFVRYYFLSAVIISTLLPLAQFSLADVVVSVQEYPIIISPVYDIVTYTLAEVTITANGSETAGLFEGIFSGTAGIMFTVYFIGFLVSLGILIFRIIQLSVLLLKSKAEFKGKIRIVHLDGAPVFSFFNTVFLDKNKYLTGEGYQEILVHESIHIAQKHTIDILLVEALLIIQWFNPFVYLLRKRVKENHEFLADNSVIGSYSDVASYSILLVENATDIKTNILTHNFSYSLLKRRLFMIKKSKSPGLFAMKMLGVIIALSMVIYACSGPVTDNGTDLTSEPKSEVFTKVEVMPEYHGGMDALVKYLSENIVYPVSAKENDIEGKSIIKFVIDQDGSVIDAEIAKGFNDDCDAEALRVVSTMPNWKPGQKDGKNVKVSFSLPIAFKLNPEDKEVFTVVEEMPKYPGGMDAMISYLVNNIKYPEDAKKNKITGRVFVSFVVEKDGSIEHVKILRGIGGGCDEEAMRVVQNMPKWIPGKQKGKAVRVAYNLPIKFALD